MEGESAVIDRSRGAWALWEPTRPFAFSTRQKSRIVWREMGVGGDAILPKKQFPFFITVFVRRGNPE